MAYYPFAPEFGGRYQLVSPDGVTAVFNDPTDPNYVGMLTDVTGLDAADVRESASDLPEADGGYHGAFYMSRRPITLNGLVFGHATILERATRLDRARRASLALRGDSTLSWKPSTRRENLVINPRVVSATGWASTFTGGLTSTSFTTSGSGGRLQATQPADTTSRSASISTATGTAGFRVVPGRSYTALGTVNHTNAPALGSRVDILWYQASGAASAVRASDSSVSVGPNTNGSFTLTGPTATAPSDAAFAAVRLFSSTTTSSDVIDVTWNQVMFTETAMGTTYFDGTTAGFIFQGDADASASGDFLEMFTLVRRQQPWRESGSWVKSFQCQLVSQYATLQGTGLKTVATGVAAENRGNWPAYPIIAITGSSTNPTVSDGTRTFRTTGLTLAAGETVEFDMLNHTGVFTAGARNLQSANRYIDFSTTQWPYLTGNGTTQTFSATGGGTTTAAIRYRDTWA